MTPNDRTLGSRENLPTISRASPHCSCWHRRSLSASSPVLSTLVLAILILVGCNASTAPTEPEVNRVDPLPGPPPATASAPPANPLTWLDAPQPEQRISTTREDLPASLPPGAPLALDVESLERAGIALSTPLDIPAEPDTFGEALADSLHQAGAELTQHDNRLVVIPVVDAQLALITRRYDLSSVEQDRQNALADAVYSATTGAYWLSADGLGGTAEFDSESSTLTVTQSFRAQERIRRFLSQELGEPVTFDPAANPVQ
ncbi:hypothetical protein Mal4_52240 [Maioricimonas rarisocia]|uniref:Uncharacterized protein n=1 Tax=Maioricimonas rarisocia TaxID=2528026 RepID=A0A517ZEH2_9PLAN|nr:hypothetical protein [Maioricimonas rarisocia]QDU40861.1 hypothetical protein Mal4_52240 [Maioricimonas rarisocia]